MSAEEWHVRAVVDQRIKDGLCPHVRPCACKRHVRLAAWLVLDALDRAGFAVVERGSSSSAGEAS
jgi:hypothetical protein